LKLQVYEALDRLALGFVDAVAPVSDDIAAALRKVPRLRRRLHVINNGVDLSEIDSVHDPAAEIANWRESGDFLVGYIGQLIPRKGIDTLIRAFSRLGTPRKRLCIVGEGPQRADLEALALQCDSTRRIHFFGFRDDRLAILKGLDVFVLPSRLEGIPRCVLEAMAVNVPVVATDIPGTRTVVRHDITGRTFRVDDDRGLAENLSRLEGNPWLREKLANAAQALVRTEFSATKMAERYAELYAATLFGGNDRRNRQGDT
jgi:glycosyltransferase involved in cell wall biosynthesis